MKKHLNLHLISDSTGETISFLAKAVLSQFPNHYIKEQQHFLIKNSFQMQKVIDSILENKGIILYTIVDEDLVQMLTSISNKSDILCIPAISPIVDQFSQFFNIKRINTAGKQHEVSEEYYKKIEAINYTLLHDDGNLSEDLHDADIILLGVSRSSKSPTSIYLAYKGYKVANVPFVKTSFMPQYFKDLKKPLIVGLHINPERLQSIRSTRLKTLDFKKNSSYADITQIKEEILEAKKYFNSLGILSINVTEKSIEETSVYILKLLKLKQDRELNNP